MLRNPAYPGLTSGSVFYAAGASKGAKAVGKIKSMKLIEFIFAGLVILLPGITHSQKPPESRRQVLMGGTGGNLLTDIQDQSLFFYQSRSCWVLLSKPSRFSNLFSALALRSAFGRLPIFLRLPETGMPMLASCRSSGAIISLRVPLPFN